MSKKCFFITPIGAEGSEQRKLADSVFEHIIEPVCAAKDYDAIRADKIAGTGQITNDIIKHIITDELVIADLTGNNPNVFYELAIRHAYQKPAIQIIHGEVLIPFDVINMRTISYKNEMGGPSKAIREIAKLIESIENGEQVSNPVSNVVAVHSLPSLDVTGITSPSLPSTNDSMKEKMTEAFMQKFIQDPTGGMEAFNALLNLKEKIENDGDLLKK